MPYFQTQSPWAQAAGVAGSGVGSMSQLALQLAQLRSQRAAQAQQMMMEQQRLGMEQQRLNQGQQQFNEDLALRTREFESKKPLTEAETANYGAETKKTNQEVSQKDQREQMAANIRTLMGAMKSPQLSAMMQDPSSSAQIVGALRAAGVIPQGQFEMQGASLLPTIQAALPAILSSEAMQTPGSAERMLVPTQLAPGRTPMNILTGEEGAQAPSVPQLKTFGRGGYGVFDPNQQSFDVLQQGAAYPTPQNQVLSPNAALGALKSPDWAVIAEQNPAIAGLVTNVLNQAAGKFQPPTMPGTNAAPKQLDANMAKQFLQQAGGDKDKARDLARQAGYTF